MPSKTLRRLSLRGFALFYLLVVLVGPVAIVCWRTFDNGIGHVWSTLTDPATVHAFVLTLEITAIAVPINTVFGIAVGLAIVRRDFPLKGLLNAFIDLPLALSPVVVGLSLFLLYGRGGWLGRLVHESRDPDPVRAPGHGARHDLRLAAVRRP